MLDLTFNPLAEKEYGAAVERYAADRSDVHLRFIETFEAAILQIREFPESGPVARGAIRSKVLSGFPVHDLLFCPAACPSNPRSCPSEASAILLAWSTLIGHDTPGPRRRKNPASIKGRLPTERLYQSRGRLLGPRAADCRRWALELSS